jgi:hypothetical protein
MQGGYKKKSLSVQAERDYKIYIGNFGHSPTSGIKISFVILLYHKYFENSSVPNKFYKTFGKVAK